MPTDDHTAPLESFDAWWETQNITANETLERAFREIALRAWEAALTWDICYNMVENQE